MSLTDLSCARFADALASREPVPGGGGASALVGALGAALGNMVGSLTAGKKKYAAVEEDILALMDRAGQIRRELLLLVERDAEAFEPLSKAYSLPKDTEEQKAAREKIMEAALCEACAPPLAIMEQCCAAIAVLEGFAEKGSVIAISDAGVGALFCRAALEGASLNVYINTKLMGDRARAAALEERADGMLAEYCPRADKVYRSVYGRLR